MIYAEHEGSDIAGKNTKVNTRSQVMYFFVQWRYFTTRIIILLLIFASRKEQIKVTIYKLLLMYSSKLDKWNNQALLFKE